MAECQHLNDESAVIQNDFWMSKKVIAAASSDRIEIESNFLSSNFHKGQAKECESG